MAEHYYCHGPSCHTYVTTDRVRGTKGNKVLRTRKITINSNGYPCGFYKFFCSTGCYNDFANKYVEQIIRIAPRTEPLETRIEDPKKTTHTTSYGYTYTNTEINKIQG